nr:uncharacterized protein CI109_005992 [Kwoniella shandongensis]KAA5525684.1 hypothetical protein CI109_005992 [Kwoniella shandongensis]
MSGMGNMDSTGSGSGGMKMYFHGSIGSDMLWFASWMPSSAGATVGVCIGLFIFAIFERYLVAFRRACDASWRKGQLGYARPTSTGTIPPSSSSAGTTTAITTATAIPNLTPPTSSRRSSTQKDLYTTPDYSSPGEKETEQQVPPGSASSSSASASSGALAAPSYSYNATSTDKEKEREQPSHMSHLPRAVRMTLDPAREGRWSRPFRWGVDLPRGLLQSLQTLIHYLLM